MFKNMKIGWRMGLGFGLVLVFMIVLIVVSLNQMEVSDDKLERIVKINNARLQVANDMIDDARETAIAVRSLLLAKYRTESSESIQKIRDGIAENRRTYNEAVVKVKKLIAKEDTKGFDLLSKVEASGDAARQLQDKVIELAVAGKHGDGHVLMVREAYPAVKQWIKNAEDFIHYNEERNAMRYDEAEKAQANARTTMFILGAVSIALAVAIAIFLTLSITRPLKLGVQAANRIASGDLTVDLSADKRRDEVGLLIQSLSKMVDALREQIREILDGVNVLASSASEISTTVTQLASSAQETAVSVSEATTTMEELRQTARVSTEKANYVSESSQKAVKISDEGRKSTEETIGGMKLIKEQMESIAESIIRLSEQSQAIGDIITSVNDIADQSNLLSVNASIEATKAGEQGKGFTVVAQEVKTLAEQSKQATAQVRTILNDIQKATSGAVMSTEQGSKAVDSGVSQSNRTGESILALSNSVREAAQAAMQIAASSQQQMAGIDQVASAMESIKQATTQNVEGSKQLETLATNLNGLGQKLKQMTERYKV
jgi:methyl-accepting chemotaxis protein